MNRYILVLALLTSLPAAAQLQWYGGLAGGEARTSRELVANRESTITLATDVRTDFDARDGAYKAFAGLRFNRVIALEVSYADLGSHRMRTTLQGGDPPLPAAITIDRRISGYGVDVVATPPLGWERVSLFGRVGAFRTRLEASAELEGNILFTGGDFDERRRDTVRRETVVKWGLGADWHVTRNLGVRLEWERYLGIGKAFEIGGQGTTGEADTEVISVGVVYRF